MVEDIEEIPEDFEAEEEARERDQEEEDNKALDIINDIREGEAPETIAFENLHTLMKSWATPTSEFLNKDLTTSNLKGKQGDWLKDVTQDLTTFNTARLFGWDKFGDYWKDNAQIKAVVSKGDNAKFLESTITQKAELKKSGLSVEGGEKRWKKL